MRKYMKFVLFFIGSLFICEDGFSFIGFIHPARNITRFSSIISHSYMPYSGVRLADPTYDSSFKALFKDKNILKAFLSDLIPNVLRGSDGSTYTVQDIDSISTDHSDAKGNFANESDSTKSSSQYKKIIFDVFCKCHVKNTNTNKSLVIDIEMQRETGSYFLDRMDYYAARKLAEQTPNARYADINPVLVIAISKNHFPNYKNSGAIFLSTPQTTLPILGIDSKTNPQNRFPMSNIACIQLDNMYDMLTNETEIKKVRKMFPNTTLLFDVLSIEQFANNKQSFTAESNPPIKVDKGIYEIDQDEIPDSIIKGYVVQNLKNCAENKHFPDEVSDAEIVYGLLDETHEKGEKVGAIKEKLQSLSNLFSENNIQSSALNIVLHVLGFKNEQDARNFFDKNKYLLEEKSNQITEH